MYYAGHHSSRLATIDFFRHASTTAIEPPNEREIITIPAVQHFADCPTFSQKVLSASIRSCK
jgi:hypothetical protein